MPISSTPYQSQYLAWLLSRHMGAGSVDLPAFKPVLAGTTHQKRKREPEDKRNQLRRRIFDGKNEIDGRRSKLIETLESRLDRKAQTTAVFTIEWSFQ